ncbi:uncharacterized protein LOC123537295 [Mercenaria mercenaria]|uniref:uncharacterized protein LOC123537295 n=1 Tax=Mercenaria mercenaria TaxID=6596 RepID=UPI00234F3DA3|nr:uncharacterized protein LOC123537295 [Mercenaria mercenaria]
MSSLRCKYNGCQKATHSENKTFKGGSSANHNIKGLLRLDSTGEVTTAQQVSDCQNLSSNHDGLNSKDSHRYNQKSYKKIVGNLTMGSLINSAGAYLDSATSYIENLCPYKTSRGLARNHSDNTSFNYLKNIISGVSKPRHNSTNPVTDLDTEPDCFKQSCKCAETKHCEEIDKTMSWTGNIFGALQNSLLSNCPAKSEKMKGVNVEKYVPPQRRYNQAKTRNVTSVVDPALTPYNAKLLEKSKRPQSHSNVKKDFLAENYQQQVHKTNGIVKSGNNLGKKCEEKVKNCCPDQETVLHCTLDSTVSCELESKCDKVIIDDQTEAATSETETDWFDYECDNAKCIPLSMEKIQLASQKCTKNDHIEDLDSNIQQLHSWFSIEAANSDSSLAKNAANLCDKNDTSNCIEKENIQIVEKMSDDTGKCAEIKKSQHVESEQLSSRCKSKSQDINEADNNYVLYVRSFGRRGRPSAKKRRRQKAQQNEAQPSSDKSSSVPKSNSAPNGTMAFILGYGTDSSVKDPHSFHVSCDIESDSDWSDSDFESDENLSSLDDETMMFASGLGFQCNDPLSNMQCFTVKCTMQPSEDSNLSSDSSAIDKINLSWRVQLSVEPESPKKKTSTTKKVHFADDNDLITVHPIIAWSHAYQAARKGPWEQYARDRGRFLRRITDSETLLKPVLHKNHRDLIFRERFCER